MDDKCEKRVEKDQEGQLKSVAPFKVPSSASKSVTVSQSSDMISNTNNIIMATIIESIEPEEENISELQLEEMEEMGLPDGLKGFNKTFQAGESQRK